MAVKKSAPRRRVALTKSCKKASQLRDPVTRRCRMPKSVAKAKAQSRARKYYQKNKGVKKRTPSSKRKGRKVSSSKRGRATA